MENSLISGLKQKLKEVDLKLRPYALVVNPDDSKVVLEAIPDIGTEVLFITNPTVPKNKIYLIDRLALRDYTQEDSGC